MRGQVFFTDIVMAMLLLSMAAYTVASATYNVISLNSEDLLYRRIEIVAHHAVDTLLLSDGSWACRVYSLRVPGCVVTGSSPQKSVFFLEDINCYLEGDPDVASLMGCNSKPSNYHYAYAVEFNACVTSTTPDNCDRKTLRLIVWK